jgi:glutathionyl-hydroquinone reductase
MLVNGVWSTAWTPYQNSSDGRFVRQSSSLRNWITPDGRPGPAGEGGFPAEAGRYHLYVALICPWASRTLMVRVLKRLESLISVSVVSPVMTDQGWRFGGFPGATADHLHGFRYLHQLYSRNDPHYSGRASVPVLWDKLRNQLVNNESADIIRMLNSSFAALAPDTPDLYPKPLQGAIDALNAFYYDKLNNGVYRAGFATSQLAYEEAYADVFAALDELEERLGHGGPYVLGETLTEVDIRLFVTLVRFDSAYHGLFKCNLRRIVDYPRISRYLERIYRLPTIAETVDFDHIRHGYYSIRRLNPNGVVPLGPENRLLECAVNG